MKILTLIPSAESYGLLSLGMLSLGSFNCARYLHLKWLHHHFSYVASHAIVKLIIVFFGLLIVPIDQLYLFNFNREILGVALGIVLGVITIFIETKMVRNDNRKLLTTRNEQSTLMFHENGFLRKAKIKINVLLFTSAKKVQKESIFSIRQGINNQMINPHFYSYSFLAVMMVAIAEEFIFRGYLLIISLSFHNIIIVCFLIISLILIFAISHLSHSWYEFKNKLPLSLSTTASFLITGTLCSPITIHVLANVYVYFVMRKNERLNYDGR